MVLTKFLQSIADAIRYADKSIDTIKANDFADRIKKLGGNRFDYDEILTENNFTTKTMIANDYDEILTENNFTTKTMIANDYDEILTENKLEESKE